MGTGTGPAVWGKYWSTSQPTWHYTGYVSIYNNVTLITHSPKKTPSGNKALKVAQTHLLSYMAKFWTNLKRIGKWYPTHQLQKKCSNAASEKLIIWENAKISWGLGLGGGRYTRDTLLVIFIQGLHSEVRGTGPVRTFLFGLLSKHMHLTYLNSLSRPSHVFGDFNLPSLWRFHAIKMSFTAHQQDPHLSSAVRSKASACRNFEKLQISKCGAPAFPK